MTRYPFPNPLPSGRSVNELRREMERLLSGFLGELPETPWTPTGRGRLPVNVWETGEAFHAELELPGVKSEDVDITVVGNEMTIKVDRPDQRSGDATYHRRERPVGTATRVVRLPSEVEVDGVEADLNRGVLTITLPKAKAARPKKIRVTAADAGSQPPKSGSAGKTPGQSDKE